MLATIISNPIIATSFSQHNSSEFSHIMPEEFGEHLTRDQRPFLHTESLQILQITVPWRCCFSSVPPSLIFYRVQVRGQRQQWLKDSFCAQWPIFVFILMFVLDCCLVEDPNMAHYKISNRGSQIPIFYLLVFDRIHDAMHLNKMFRTSSRKTGPQH